MPPSARGPSSPESTPRGQTGPLLAWVLSGAIRSFQRAYALLRSGAKLVVGLQHFNRQAFESAVDQQFADMQAEIWKKSSPLARVATGTGVALSIGYVAWFLRGGALASALMGTMPVWRSFDPLPVVHSPKRKPGHGAANSDEERIFDMHNPPPIDTNKKPEALRLETSS